MESFSREVIRHINMKQLFLGQDGNKILQGQPDNLSLYFDWQVTNSGIYGTTNIPKSVYIKTDFLPLFVTQILPILKEEFILITACSDYSPEINFNSEYNLLISNPLVKTWYMNNLKTKTSKTFSLPAGLAAGKFWNNCTEEMVDNFLLNIRSKIEKDKKINKVFCCFRNRDWNVCGEDMIIRPKIIETIKNRTDIFDFYNEDSLNFEDFVTTLSKYKYSLCPHGNGMDPNPNAWISLITYTTPVIYKTENSLDMFKDIDSVIYFEKFDELLEKKLYEEKSDVNFEFLTNEYWAKKIKNEL